MSNTNRNGLAKNRSKNIWLIALIVAVLAALATAAAPAQASSGGHWCRQGDPPIWASNSTSCAFAGNIVNAYYQHGYGHSAYRARVFSPATHRWYSVQYMSHMFSMRAWVIGNSSIWAGFSTY